MPAAHRAGDRPAAVFGVPVCVPGATALQVREVQVRARMAFRELAADRLITVPDAASRRNARVLQYLA
jgi:hypothetical protein